MAKPKAPALAKTERIQKSKRHPKDGKSSYGCLSSFLSDSVNTVSFFWKAVPMAHIVSFRLYFNCRQSAAPF
jgi:hypothetical protein